MEITSLLTAVWILIVFIVLFFLLPQKLFPNRIETSSINKILSNSIYAILVVIMAGNLLPRANLFNWFTLLLCYFIWPGFYWLGKNFGQAKNLLKDYFINKYLQVLDLLEFDTLRKDFFEYFSNKKQNYFLLLKSIIKRSSNPVTILGISFFIIIFSFTITVNFSQPLKELRFPFVESYQTLLQSWQVLLNQQNNNIIFLPPIIAAISTLAGINAFEVVRFFSPILLCLLILIVAITVWNLTNYKSIGLVTFYFLAVNIFYLPKEDKIKINDLSKSLIETVLDAFGQNLSEYIFSQNTALAFIILLLTLNFFNDFIKGEYKFNFTVNKRNLVNILICLILLGLISPLMLLPSFITMLALLIIPPIALFSLSLSLIMLVLFLEVNHINFSNSLTSLTNSNNFELKFILPIALALCFASICQFLIYLTKFLLKHYSELIVAVLAIAISITFLPKYPNYQYVEYDISARKTLEIAQKYPKKQWLIVAPVEQLAISYGYGWYEDLNKFTSKYQDKVKKKDFSFSFPLDVFIFVEKKPFIFFKQEPNQVPFSLLTDLSYKNYRSLAGRASLEQQAITLCETYRENHPELKLYYEDEVLRIYFIAKNTD